jgi:KipI family sensor histidine kinase inhibitor
MGWTKPAESMGDWRLLPMADTGLLLQWRGSEEETRAAVQRQAAMTAGYNLRGVIDVVPGLDSVLVCYDPLVMTAGELKQALDRIQHDGTFEQRTRSVAHEILVVYGGSDGPDLGDIARAAGLSEAEVVALHTSRPMPVLMIGFMPGYPYIGELPEPLHLPRRAAPRVAVPAGSVAIANDQTGIYPSRSPGGWHIIGRTEVRLFDPLREPPALLQAGDDVRFVALNVL